MGGAVLVAEQDQVGATHALGLGAGSMSRRPLGYAIIGGMLFSTMLTLFLVPVVYVLLDALKAKFTAKRATPRLEPATEAR